MDYSFRIRGVSRFLLEAKSLGEALEDRHVQQALDYAWNAGVDWVVLCNFSELKLYYASSQRAARLRPFIELGAEDYEARFAELWLLGREATEKPRTGAERRRH